MGNSSFSHATTWPALTVGLSFAAFHEAFSLGELLEVVRRLAGLGLRFVRDMLEGHGI